MAGDGRAGRAIIFAYCSCLNCTLAVSFSL